MDRKALKGSKPSTLGERPFGAQPVIEPLGPIREPSPAAQALIAKGVIPVDISAPTGEPVFDLFDVLEVYT